MKGTEMGEEWLVRSSMLVRVPRNNKRKRSRRFRLLRGLEYPLEEVHHKMFK